MVTFYSIVYDYQSPICHPLGRPSPFPLETDRASYSSLEHMIQSPNQLELLDKFRSDCSGTWFKIDWIRLQKCQDRYGNCDWLAY